MKKASIKPKELLENRSVLSVTLTVILIFAIAAVNVFAYAVTNTFGLYFHSPSTEDTVSGNTDAMFREAISAKEQVRVTFCMDESQLSAHSTGSLVYQTAKALMERYKDNNFIEINYINIITGLDQSGNRVDLSKYQKDMRGNDTAVNSSTVIFECGEQYKVVTDTYTKAGFYQFYTLDSGGNVYAYNGEEVFASMIAWVLTPDREHGTAYLTQNHGETADMSLTTVLSCAGYYVDLINLRQSEVPSDADLIIISAPTSDFERGADGSGVRTEIERLGDYMDRGGNLLVLFDPMVKKLPVFEAFLEKYGFRMPSVADESGSFSRYLVKENGASITTDGMSFVATPASTDGNIAVSDIYSAMSNYGGNRVLISRSGYLELSEGARPLLMSSPDAVAVSGGEVYDTSGNYAVAAYNAVAVGTDGKYARIAVIPDVYITSSEATVTNTYTNKNFIYATLNVLFGATSAPYGCKNIMTSTTVLEGLTQGTARGITAVILAVPVAIAAVGAVVLIRRKHR